MKRYPFTAAVKAHLETYLGFPVGLGKIPANASWDGPPNKEGTNFTPFVLVIPQTATISEGPLNDDQADWILPYSIQSFGAEMGQAEAMADTVRECLSLLAQDVVIAGETEARRIQSVQVINIGGLQKVDNGAATFWGENDIVHFRTAKMREVPTP